MSPTSNFWTIKHKPIGRITERVSLAYAFEERLVELSAGEQSRYAAMTYAYFSCDPELRQKFFKGRAVLVYRSDKPQLWIVQSIPIPKPPTES